MSGYITSKSPATDIVNMMSAMAGSEALKFKIPCASNADAEKLRQRMNHLRRMDRRRITADYVARKVKEHERTATSLFDKLVFEVPEGRAEIIVHNESGPGLLNILLIVNEDGSETPYTEGGESLAGAQPLETLAVDVDTLDPFYTPNKPTDGDFEL